MAALVGNLTSVWRPFDWTLLFARQPEPDLEFTEEELDQTITTKARGPPFTVTLGLPTAVDPVAPGKGMGGISSLSQVCHLV